MSQNQTENIPEDHDEAVCSGGVTMCHECYAAGADAGDAS